MSGKPDHDTAGSIRSAGGSFAKMEIAHEEEYFYKQASRLSHQSQLQCFYYLINYFFEFQRQEQLHKLKEAGKQGGAHELEFREKAVKDHEDAITRHKKAIEELRKK